MRDRVITVFGGSGFIGRHLIRRLAAQRAMIRVPTRHPVRAGFLRPMGDVGQIVPLRWSARDRDALPRVVTGSTDVVSLIGILHESRRGDFASLQGELPGQIAAAAAAAGVARVVHVSAIGADADSASAYARTKAQGETTLRAAFPAAPILRPSIVFGPEDKFFNRFARMAQFSPALPLVGGGTTRFQPVYVGDVADAIVACLTRADAAGRTYELGGPKIYTFRELLEYLLQILDRQRPLVTLPYGLARLQARVLQHLPDPPLTPDQLELLKTDNIVAAEAAGFADLGLTPSPLEVIVPDYVRIYARGMARIPAA